MNLSLLLVVMAGGALGAGLRFVIGHYAMLHWGDRLPWGTLVANLVGAFAAGALLVWLDDRGPTGTVLRAFLLVGLLGGLTTYSALMLESLLLVRGGRAEALAGYLALTLAGGFLAVWLGARTVEAWRGGPLG
jgi:CrcB protein